MMRLIDGDDGLPASEVGPWAKDKHKYLSSYIDISKNARKNFLFGRAKSATYIDLFCGPGRAKIQGTDEWIDGSAIAAWQMSKEGGAPFSEIFVADTDEESRKATVERLKRLNADCPVRELEGSAVDAAAEVVERINPHGLHFAFIDPFGLRDLDFQIIRSLAKRKRMDMLIHVSKQGLQRGQSKMTPANKSALDKFAPGCRDKISQAGSKTEIRALVLDHWKELVKETGKNPSDNWKLLKADQGQLLYWLLLVAKHDLAHKFWKATTDIDSQRKLL